VEGSSPKNAWSRKDEEYLADFTILARRTLSESEHQLFKFHYLLGADWKLCARRLKLDRGTFFHTIYRIQTKLGRVFAETQPYALYPLNDYFNQRNLNVTPIRFTVQNAEPVRPPIRGGALRNRPDQKAA
jgi:hypothetical protein